MVDSPQQRKADAGVVDDERLLQIR